MLKAIKAGIFSYILKPWDRFYLLSEVKKAIDIYTLKEENRRNVERMRDELRWAGELQRRILEVHPTETPKISFGIKYEPVGDLECGGDYYDVLHPSEDRYLLAIGDVSGHGVRAAFVTSILKTILSGDHVKAMITDDPDPGRLVTWLNTRIHDELHNLPDVVATFALCSLDLRSYRLRFACAGHLPAYLIRNDRIRAIHTDGPGLAFLRDVPYESVEVRLKRSDRIVLFSDGLYQTGADEPEQVRRGRTENTMLYAMNSDDFVSELVESSRSLAGDGRFEDDVTVVSAYLK
jgi:sigma-B regulation protein RsbU (phosphoserine phosphatase)